MSEKTGSEEPGSGEPEIQERGGFLARWSRRKVESRQAEAPATPEPALDEVVVELPPIESLGAASDYTVFLARGVSQAMQAQALRIAWASDPAIADFRGMAEYAWDFNAPGYGALAPGDDAAVWLGQIVRSGAKIVATVVAEAPGASEDGSQGPALPAACVPATPTGLLPVAAPREEPAPMIATDVPLAGAPQLDAPILDVPVALPVRRHGGAMPA